MPIRTLSDVIEHEKTPIWERIPEHNVYERLQNVASRLPDHVALRSITTTAPTEVPREISFRDFFKKITQAANLMTSLGVGPTDAVSLLVPQVPEGYIALFGAMAAGVANPINPLLDPDHLIAIMRAAATAVLVVGAATPTHELGIRIAAARAALPGLKAVLWLGRTGSPPPFTLDFEAALASQPDDHLIAPRRLTRSDLGALFHTGGTTGKPKLARHTQGGLLAVAHTNAIGVSEEPGALILGGLPLFHIGGALIIGLARFACGQGVILPTATGLRNPEVIRDYWQLVERHAPSFIGGVPTSLGALLRVPTQGRDISTVRFCLSGASALPVQVAEQFSRQFGVPMIEGYGMTEVHGYSTINPVAGEVRVGSVGLRLPYLELGIAEVDPSGAVQRFCAPHEIGHVLMRGPQVFTGYQDPRDNRGALLADGWLDSGDLGRLDAEGYLWLTGRAKDLIIRGGHNIDPGQIEQALYRHPAVELAAAVPAPDSYAGELPVAFVQLRPGQHATAEELLAFCREHIGERAAVPVEVITERALPLSPIGKIFKPALRLEAARRVFQRQVSQLADSGIQARVDVVAHPEHGTLARIHIEHDGGLPPGEIASQVRRLLGGYALRHELVSGAYPP